MTADSTLDSELFVLTDKWPNGRITYSVPTGGFTGATHNQTTETGGYVMGDKVIVPNLDAVAGKPGYSTFIYLKGLAITEANPTCAARQVVVPSLLAVPYQVTNDSDQALIVTGCGLCAMMISVMSFDNATAYYGWFWCGGVCPEGHVSGLGGTYVTNGDVVIGPIAAADLTTPDTIGLGNAAGQEGHIGFSYADDA